MSRCVMYISSFILPLSRISDISNVSFWYNSRAGGVNEQEDIALVGGSDSCNCDGIYREGLAGKVLQCTDVLLWGLLNFV